MDLAQRPEGPVDECIYHWKTAVISAAVGQFAIETYINWRQFRALRRWSAPSQNGSPAWDIKRTRFRIFNSFCSMVQVAALIGLDAVPALWRFVVEKENKLLERTNLSHLFISHDFDRSAMFIICCYIAFLLINIPTYLYRILVLKERVIRDFYSPKNHNWVVRDMAKGRPVSAVMFFTGICAWEFKIFGLKFDGNYVIGVGLCQLLFVILYPIFTQPKRKSLSIMGPGRTKDAIEEVAATAKFPLKNTYIIDDQGGQNIQAFGLPRKKCIGIPKTMIEESTTDDIIGLTAHAMGSWKYSNGFRIFCMGQLYFNLTWTYLVLFSDERTNYTAFGFKNEYPRMAAIVIFVVGFAPLIAAILGLNINYMGRKNDFIADKYAAELGHSAELTQALTKAQVAEGSGDIYFWFSLYYNPGPALSERLVALEELREDMDVKDERLISLSDEEKK